MTYSRKAIWKMTGLYLLPFIAAAAFNVYRYRVDVNKGIVHPFPYWVWQEGLVTGVLFFGFFLGMINTVMAYLYRKTKK